jgi:hypothetical protein
MARVKTKRGRPLMREEVNRLADEAERGYDLSRATSERVGPGRPSLAEGESPRISYRVAPGLLTDAQLRAKEEGRSLSELAREALERYLAG